MIMHFWKISADKFCVLPKNKKQVPDSVVWSGTTAFIPDNEMEN